MKGWKSHEAMEETIRRDTSSVALALHQSDSLIRKWKERPNTDEDYNRSGARNPLDRIEIIIETIEKIDSKRAYVPIQWLCARFGFMPPVNLPVLEVGSKDIQSALLKWTQEFGETCAEVSKVLEDNRVTMEAVMTVYREFMEDIQAGMVLCELLRKMADE